MASGLLVGWFIVLTHGFFGFSQLSRLLINKNRKGTSTGTNAPTQDPVAMGLPARASAMLFATSSPTPPPDKHGLDKLYNAAKWIQTLFLTYTLCRDPGCWKKKKRLVEGLHHSLIALPNSFRFFLSPKNVWRLMHLHGGPF